MAGFGRLGGPIIAALLLIGCESAAPDGAVQPDTWPMLGHDLTSSFNNQSETTLSRSNVEDLKEAWTLEARVYGTPAIVGDRVYIVGLFRTRALSITDGAAVWENTQVRGTSSPAYDAGVLFVNDGSGVVHALDAETGAELWQAEVDPHPMAAGWSSPVVVGELVIVGVSSNEEFVQGDVATFRESVVALDRDTGREVWRYYTVEPPSNGVAVWSTVSVDTEARRVFAATGNNYTGPASDKSDAILALDLDTGDLVWSRQLTEGDVFTAFHRLGPDADFGANPIQFEANIDGEDRPLVGAGQKSGVFWALDRESGEVVWST